MSVETAMAGVQIGTSVAGYFSGKQQQRASTEMANYNAMLESQAAWDAYEVNKKILAKQADEISDQATTEAGERALLAQLDLGKIAVMAGEAGIGGNTVQRLKQDAMMQAGRDTTSININRENKLQQNAMEVFASYMQAVGGSNKAETRRRSAVAEADAKAPTLLGTGLQIAGAAGKYYTDTRRGSTPINKV